jgi:hypothetical protein
MNFAPHVPWYRRFVFGDQWPNKTHWNWLQAEFRGAHIIVERHKPRECSCSYCEGEHGHGMFWMPSERKYGWRVINLFHRVYIRWVPRG